MGFWGCVCEFDEQRYRDVVVPALRAGGQHPIVEHTRSLLFASYRKPITGGDPELTFDGLREVMASFSCDLRSRPGTDQNWVAPAGWHRDDLVRLFEWIVTRETVASFANLGLTGSFLNRLWTDGDANSFGVCSPVFELENQVSFWTVDGCGIVGWLSAAQTRAMRPAMPAALGHDNHLVRDRQLRFLAVLDRAVGNDRGLLWGRDLALCYRPEAIFADGRAMPVQL